MIDIYDYQRREYSQRGEDGMIECILNTLGIQKGWCCEFGAWDGVHLSNVYNLITKGWSSVLIEGDKNKFKELQWNMKDFPDVYCHNSFVSLEGSERLNSILSNYPIPEEFDLLSLDIDSWDYWVWASLTYSPKIVVIEYNSNWEEAITIPYDPKYKSFGYTQYFGASALALKRLGDRKGYDLIGFVPYTNLFFVKRGLNRNLFKKVDLAEGKYIQTPHHGPMTIEEEARLIYNPPFRWEDVRK